MAAERRRARRAREARKLSSPPAARRAAWTRRLAHSIVGEACAVRSRDLPMRPRLQTDEEKGATRSFTACARAPRQQTPVASDADLSLSRVAEGAGADAWFGARGSAPRCKGRVAYQSVADERNGQLVAASTSAPRRRRGHWSGTSRRRHIDSPGVGHRRSKPRSVHEPEGSDTHHCTLRPDPQRGETQAREPSSCPRGRGDLAFTAGTLCRSARGLSSEREG